MELSKPGKSVYLKIAIWYDEPNNRIHMTSNEIEGFHTWVTADPKSVRCHSTLYEKLARCLHEAGAPAPMEGGIDRPK